MDKVTTLKPLQTRPSLRNLLAGDSVFVWDGIKETNIWQTVADIKEVDGRMRIRVEGTNFYFDESLVIDHAVCRDREGEDSPLTFCGYHCHIEFTTEFPLAGSPLCAVRTKERGLTLAFVTRIPVGFVRLDAFDGSTEPRQCHALEVEMIGRIVLQDCPMERSAAA